MSVISQFANVLVQVSAWLAAVWLAAWWVRRSHAAVQWRVLLLRAGLAGIPVIVVAGLLAPRLPWSYALWQIASEPSASPECKPVSVAQAPAAPVRNAAPVAVPAGAYDASLSLDSRQSIHTPAVPEAAAASAVLPCVQDSVSTSPGPLLTTTVSRPADSTWNWRGAILPTVGWLLAGVWLAGSAIAAVRLCVGLVRLARRRASWPVVTHPRVRELAAQIAGRVGLRRSFRLLAADDLPMPLAMGVWRPTVVVPREQFEVLRTAEGRAVLAHELAHLRFADPLWRLLDAVIGAALWFHPLMRWLSRTMEIDSEFQCDQAALGTGADRRRYARLLVGLAELAWSNRPLAAAAIGAVHRTSHLERRLGMILSKTSAGVTTSRLARIMAVSAAVMLMVSFSSVVLLAQGAPPPVGPDRVDDSPKSPAGEPGGREDRLGGRDDSFGRDRDRDRGRGRDRNHGGHDDDLSVRIDDRGRRSDHSATRPDDRGRRGGDSTSRPEDRGGWTRPGGAGQVEVILRGGQRVVGTWVRGTPEGMVLEVRGADGKPAIKEVAIKDIAVMRMGEDRGLMGSGGREGERRGFGERGVGLFPRIEADRVDSDRRGPQGERGMGRPGPVGPAVPGREGGPDEAVRAQIRDLAGKADQFYADGKYEQALGVLSEMRKLAPRNPAIVMATIRTWEKAGKDVPEELRKAAREMRDAGPGADRSREDGPRGGTREGERRDFGRGDTGRRGPGADDRPAPDVLPPLP